MGKFCFFRQRERAENSHTNVGSGLVLKPGKHQQQQRDASSTLIWRLKQQRAALAAAVNFLTGLFHFLRVCNNRKGK